MKVLSLDDSLDTQENQQMKDVLGKQGQLEKMKLPETAEDLEAIASDSAFSKEFLTNINYMQ